MKKILRTLKKGLAILLCLVATYTAIPMLNYLDVAGYSHPNSHSHDHNHDCGMEHGKGFIKALFEGYSISAKAASCPHNRLSPQYCEAAHPHANFVDCWDCGLRIYVGGTTYKSNCSTCNPALNCRHTGSKWTDPAHPHGVYCQTCSKLLSYGYVSYCLSCNPCAAGHSYGSTSYSSTHPHHGYRYCSRCGNSSYVGTTTMSSCITCNPCANGHIFTDGPWVDATHTSGKGHAEYYYCDTGNCTVKQYTGNYAYKSNCKQCNPDLECKHTGDTWTDTSHPHAIYCCSCSAIIQSFSTLSWCSLCQTQGSSSIVITAWTNLTTVSGSGILSIEHSKEINDCFNYEASVTGNDSIKSVVCTGLGGTYSGGNVELTNRNIGTFTITATTTKGATKTISVTIKTQTPGVGDIRYRTIGMNVNTIKGNGLNKPANGRIALEGASIIPESEHSKIAGMVGRYDGGTYTLNGSLVISVSNIKTGKEYGEYDVLTEYGALTSDFEWGQNTLQDFQTMQRADVTYQAPKQINATAIYCSQDRGTVFGSVTAQQQGAPQYIFPYETYSVSFDNSLVFVPSGWQYHGVQWTFNPQGNGYSNGSAVGQSSVEVTFNKDTPACTFHFYWKEDKGSIAVKAVDSHTGNEISAATVSLDGSSGRSGTIFSDLDFGTYTASASADGYYAGSGKATISAKNPTATITIPLTKIPPQPDVNLNVEIQTNGTYRKGSTVIVSALCSSDVDVTTSNPAAVSLIATYQKKTGSGHSTVTITSQTKDIIIPGGESNLVWFEFTLPTTGYLSDIINLECILTPPDNMSGNKKNASKILNISEHTQRSSPNPGYEDSAPHLYSVPPKPARENPRVTWSVWEWVNNSFQKKTYSASLVTHASLNPDSTAGYQSYNSATGMWSTRSGYGVNTQLNVSVNNIEGAIAGTAKADAYYPEFDYSVAVNKSSSLLLDGSTLGGGQLKHSFVFRPNLSTISRNNMHMTPIWFPDGQYTVHYQVYDIWTPGGELTASENATILIEGNMYDDSYVLPQKP